MRNMPTIEPTTGNCEIKADTESLKKVYRKFTLRELGRELDDFSPSNSSSAQDDGGLL
jgi:hypothetical protein